MNEYRMNAKINQCVLHSVVPGCIIFFLCQVKPLKTFESLTVLSRLFYFNNNLHSLTKTDTVWQLFLFETIKQ